MPDQQSDPTDPPPPTELGGHRRHDYQSLLMHTEAVRRIQRDPGLVFGLQRTIGRWRATCDPRSLPLFDE